MWITNSEPTLSIIIEKYIEAISMPFDERKELHKLSEVLSLCLDLNNYPLNKGLLKRNSHLITLLVS